MNAERRKRRDAIGEILSAIISDIEELESQRDYLSEVD